MQRRPTLDLLQLVKGFLLGPDQGAQHALVLPHKDEVRNVGGGAAGVLNRLRLDVLPVAQHYGVLGPACQRDVARHAAPWYAVCKQQGC